LFANLQMCNNWTLIGQHDSRDDNRINSKTDQKISNSFRISRVVTFSNDWRDSVTEHDLYAKHSWC